jgi:predicted metalloprotease
MKWEGHRQSDNVEDRRAGGGRSGMRLGGGKGIGLGTIAIALVAGWIFGINPMTVLSLLGGEGGAPEAGISAGPSEPGPAPTDRSAVFVSTVLADTEDVWKPIFAASQARYDEPVLVLFRGATPTACGTGQSAMGPFYCPGDSRVYIDLDFFDALQQQLGAPGEFARAYVIAHEVGHHIQNLLGISAKVQAQRQRLPAAQANALSVRTELQADCLAGVWTHHSQKGKGWLDQGDIAAAMNAAARIGDDTLQRQAGGAVRPESFTHGSSEQRQRWFRRGLDGGRMADCNTFDAAAL